MFGLFGFLGVERALKRLRGVGLEPRILAWGAIVPSNCAGAAEYTRALDMGRILPAGGSATWARLDLCGQVRIVSAAVPHRQCG